MNLQFALIILGIAVVLGIYFFSRWQEKQHNRNRRIDRRRGASGTPSRGASVDRDEPSFDAPGLAQPTRLSSEIEQAPDVDYGEVSEGGKGVEDALSPAVDDLVDADYAAGISQDDLYAADDVSGHRSEQEAGHGVNVDDDLYDDVDAEDRPTHAVSSFGAREDTWNTESSVSEQQEVDDVPVLESRVDDVSSPVEGNNVSYSANTTPVAEEETLPPQGEDPPVLTDAVPLAEEEFREGEDEFSSHDASSEIDQIPAVEKDLSGELPIEPQAGVDARRSLANSEHGQFQPDPTESVDASQDNAADEFETEEDDRQSLDEATPTLNGGDGEHEYDADKDESIEDHSALRPSLSKFINSIGPINKLKQNIQHKLDNVKAERERALSGEDEYTFSAVAETIRDPEDDRERQRSLFDSSAERPAAAAEPTMDVVADNRESDIDSAADVLSSEGADPSEENNSLVDESSEIAVPQDQGRIEPQVSPTPGAAPNGGIQPAEGFDKLSQIDYYVKLSGERDVSRDSVLAIYREGAAGIARHHSIYGLKLPQKVWRDLEQEPEEARFGDLVVTIQLVDQEGLVTEDDMTRFSSLIMKLSESTGRGFAFMAPIENAHQQARAIEEFKQRFDSIFVVNIKPLEGELFEGTVIERCASQIGLTPDNNNFYARYKPVGKQQVCLYSLANMSDTGEFDLDNMRAMRTRGVTFFTRPAINRSPGAVFSEMVDAAKAFASRIKGEVIAPGYEDLSTEDIESIRHSIEQVASQMEEYGINPGSEEATRLFG